MSAGVFPETAAGGYRRHDSRTVFYTRVQALMPDDEAEVLDLGAGSGSWWDRLPIWQRCLCNLRGGPWRVVWGADADPAVLGNRTVDRARLIENGVLPFDGESLDMVVAYAVLEHVAEPEKFAAEVRRVLKPGGWFCAWTPNRWGYVGIGARLVPSRWHARLLTKINPHDKRAEADVFPTVYRMNTRGAIRRLFPGWVDATHALPGPCSYSFGRAWVARLIGLWQRLAPDVAQTELHVFVRKTAR